MWPRGEWLQVWRHVSRVQRPYSQIVKMIICSTIGHHISWSGRADGTQDGTGNVDLPEFLLMMTLKHQGVQHARAVMMLNGVFIWNYSRYVQYSRVFACMPHGAHHPPPRQKRCRERHNYKGVAPEKKRFPTCSGSRRRAEKVDKRMVLVYTHGLFIT